MKLEFPTIEVEKSGQFKESNFSLGDPRVIMNILRSKMYTQPVYVICQEIMSNSRDANREAGRSDRPIEVTLPSEWSDQIQFKDFGIGISPTRMENVFIRYGTSTKRSDNLQTGGFGLGAKTPFSYSDSFNITTVTEENGKRIKRTYIAYVDNTQLGAMNMVHEIETEEETGTVISMAVRKDDYKAFSTAVRTIGMFWNPRPIVKGQDNFDWETITYTVQGNGWAMTNGPALSTRKQTSVVLIDGIPYSLRTDALFPTGHAIHSNKEIGLMQKLSSNPSVILDFKVGELAVTANREDLDYQPDVLDKIHNILLKIIVEARAEVNKSIANAKNLWEASIIWQNVRRTYHGFGINPQWNGMELLEDTINLYGKSEWIDDPSGKRTHWCSFEQVKVFNGSEDVKVSVFNLTEEGEGVELSRQRTYRRTTPIRDIAVKKSFMVVEDEIGSDKPDRARVLTVLKGSDDEVDYVAVVSFKTQAAKDWVVKNLHWDHWGTTKLSCYPKTVRTSLIKRGGYKIYKVKQLARHSRALDWVADNSRNTADGLGGVYVVLKNGIASIGKGITATKETLEDIEDLLKIKIHAFLYKWSRKDINPAWRPLYDVIKEEADKLEKQPTVQHILKYGLHGSAEKVLHSTTIEKLLTNQELQASHFREWLEATNNSRKAVSDINKLNTLRKYIKKPIMDYERGVLGYLGKRCLAKYGLLNHIEHSSKHRFYIPNLVKYVNMVDKEQITNV